MDAIKIIPKTQYKLCDVVECFNTGCVNCPADIHHNDRFSYQEACEWWVGKFPDNCCPCSDYDLFKCGDPVAVKRTIGACWESAYFVTLAEDGKIFVSTTNPLENQSNCNCRSFSVFACRHR